MKKKLSKTEKIKRLRAIKKALNEHRFMCNSYTSIGFDGDLLFTDIPELLKQKPKHCDKTKNYWTDPETFMCLDKEFIKLREGYINKAIKLIQSK